MTETTAVLEASTQSTKRRLNRIAVAVAVAMLPAWSLSFAESARGVVLTMITVVAVLVVLATAIDGEALAGLRTRPATVILYAVLAVGAIIAFVFNASGAGAILAFSIVAPIGIVLSVSRYSISELRSYVALPLLVTTAIQAVVVAVQTATESAVGYSLLHPGGTLLVTNDTIVRPQGMFDHVYEPAAVALITIGIGLALLPESGRLRTGFLVGVGAAATTIALTHSRSALLGLLLVLLIAAIAAFRGDRGLRAGLVVVAAAFVIPALLTASAWQVRFDESATSDLDDASLGRVTLARQAITMAGDHPIVGVGPNRYMAVLEAKYTVDETYPYVVHNEPLMLAAELGIPAAVVVTLLLVWAGAQAVRAGYRPLLLYAAPLAFVVFDVLLYNKPVGLLLFAVWAGVMAAMSVAGRKSLVASRESRYLAGGHPDAA